MTQEEYIHLGLYILGGIVVGLIMQKLVMPILVKLAKKSKIQADDLVVKVLCAWMVPLFLVLGLHFGLQNSSLSPKILNWMQRGTIIFYILSATIIAATILGGLLRIKNENSDSVIPSSSIISKIAKVMVYILGFILILQSQGISVLGILTTLGVGGIAVALALKDTLSNLFAGLQVISSGKFNNGDFVRLSSGEEGYVEDISWRSTVIRAVDKHTIIVPNNELANMIVHNYYLNDRSINFGVEYGVAYDSDLDKVEAITIEVVTETLQNMEQGVKDFEPFVRFTAFGDSSINMKAFLRVNSVNDQYVVKSEFVKRLQKRFSQEGINIPFPIRTLQMEKIAPADKES